MIGSVANGASRRKLHPEPVSVTNSTIRATAHRISPYVRQTPVFLLEKGAFGLDGQIYLKMEFLQHGGSFKVRGAFNRMLRAKLPPAGVVAASGGNHGIGVAYAARRLGCRAEIFVPELTPPAKLSVLRSYGADVRVGGAGYADALAFSKLRVAETKAIAAHAYDDPDVISGQGTIGLEIEEQIPDPDTILVAVGGGGLVSGIAAWFGKKVKVVAVEPQNCPTLFEALRAGKPVEVKTGGVASDSLGAKRFGDFCFPIAAKYVDRTLLVTDEQILAAQRVLWRELRLAVEPGGACAFAALLSGVYQPSKR